MATRTIGLTIESGGYTTGGEGEWVAFFPSSGTNTAFGSSIPETISFSFPSSGVYANYASSVTMKWTIDIKVNDSWYTVYEGQKSMSKSNSDFSLSATSIDSDLASALQSHAIDEIGIFQNGSRQIKGVSGTTASCTITYTEVTVVTPSIEWSNRTVTCTQNGDAVNVSWYPAVGYNDSGSVYYYLFCGSEDNMVYSGTATSATVYPPTYNEEYAYYVLASYSTAPERWSATTYFTATKSTEVHYIIRCYLNGSWQDCIVKYYDGTAWIECTPHYYDGSAWQTCSF